MEVTAVIAGMESAGNPQPVKISTKGHLNSCLILENPNAAGKKSKQFHFLTRAAVIHQFPDYFHDFPEAQVSNQQSKTQTLLIIYQKWKRIASIPYI